MYCTQANVSGTVTATGGKIGGWTISTDGKLTTQKEIYVNPGSAEVEVIRKHLNGDEIIPANEIALYDFNCDGVVTITDFVLCNSMANGTSELANIDTDFAKQKTNVTVTIDPTDLASTFKISGVNMWGRSFTKKFGCNNLFADSYSYDDFNMLVRQSTVLQDKFNEKADKTEATQTKAGLMSAADKTKLDNVPSSSGTTSKALTVQANGSQVFTFNGSAAKTLNIKAGTNVTLTSDTSGNITINARSGTGTGDVGDVLYEATNDYGIYCDGKTTLTNTNSVTLNDPDPNGGYKRFRIYVRTVYGLASADMPVDRPQGGANSPWGSYQGGIVFPTGDHSNGATLNYLAKIHWRIVPPSSGSLGWKFQVTDSGWVNLGTGAVSQADYIGNKSVAVTNAAPTWNQRHNNNYSVYKIVGYTV